jgi:hypothetical protein
MLRSDQRQTDINGEANLFGVAPSEQEFQVEAAGFEVFKFALTPIARTTTVQRCVLAEASGKIVVTLKGQASGKYLISYCHPTEGTGGHLQDLHLSDSAELVIENLPKRRYLVFARGAVNGPIAQGSVDLSLTGGEAHVVLDVSGLVPIK